MAAGLLQQAEQARQAITARDRDAALDHVRQAQTLAQAIEKSVPPKTNPILVPVYSEGDAATTSGRLDVTTAADRLESARSALERNDWTAADTALAAIPNGIIRTTVVPNLPLLSARENLTLARNLVLDSRYREAAAPLRSAAKGLADFEKIAPGPRVHDVEYMRQKMETFARDMDGHHADAAQEIGYWLDDVNRWYDEFTR